MGLMFRVGLASAACLAAPMLATASQVTLTFSAPGGGSGIESQFRCIVSDPSPGTASFRFTNEVGAASSVMRVGFGRSTLLAGEGTLVQEGCSFVLTPPTGAVAPGALPFRLDQLYNAEFGDNPASGLDCLGDRFEVRFAIGAGQTFADVVAALGKGSLRVAMGQAQPGGGTEWSVSDPGDSVVPLPPAATAGAALLGLLGIQRLRRRAG